MSGNRGGTSRAGGKNKGKPKSSGAASQQRASPVQTKPVASEAVSPASPASPASPMSPNHIFDAAEARLWMEQLWQDSTKAKNVSTYNCGNTRGAKLDRPSESVLQSLQSIAGIAA
eukprot:Rhum_TRINITY_DN14946_c6_g1::Rhum_TRINITY_DN14946_c6_g1_i1::g.132389::m.132389